MSTLNSPPVEVSELAQSEGGPPALTTGGPVSGIYGIWCETNEKWYVGQSVNVADRIRRHIRNLRNQQHANPHLQHAWNNYGARAFLWVKPEIVPETELDDAETHYISALSAAVPGGFNLKTGGAHGRPAPETLEKLRVVMTGKRHSPEAKLKMVAEMAKRKAAGTPGPFSGHRHSVETREKMSKTRRGKTASPETRKRMSETKKARGIRPPGFEGKRHSPETRAKLSALAKRRRASPETKQKMSITRRRLAMEQKPISRARIKQLLKEDPRVKTVSKPAIDWIIAVAECVAKSLAAQGGLTPSGQLRAPRMDPGLMARHIAHLSGGTPSAPSDCSQGD